MKYHETALSAVQTKTSRLPVSLKHCVVAALSVMVSVAPAYAANSINAYEADPNSSFHGQTNARISGQPGSQTITGSFTSNNEDSGKNGFVFVAVYIPPTVPFLGNNFFFMDSSRNWVMPASLDCSAMPAFYSGPLRSMGIPLVPTPMDLGILRNTSLYIGYGLGSNVSAACENMLSNNLLKEALRLP